MPCVIECQNIDLCLLLLSAAHSGNLHMCFKSAGNNIKSWYPLHDSSFHMKIQSIHIFLWLLTIFIQKLNLNFPFEIWSGLKNRLWTTLV